MGMGWASRVSFAVGCGEQPFVAEESFSGALFLRKREGGATCLGAKVTPAMRAAYHRQQVVYLLFGGGSEVYICLMFFCF